MERTTIAQAVKTLESTLQILDDAYWGASSIYNKDNIYDLISVLQKELSELAKLSVEDHYMAYEPITVTFKNSISKLKVLRSDISQWVSRTETATNLEQELPALLQLLAPAN